MRMIAGVLMVVAGIIAGLYIGIWWAFIGGIVEGISIVKAKAGGSANG